MFNILETVDLYEDTWLLTFYFVLSFSLLIGTAWTCYQMFWKRDKKKEPLKENIIYNNSDDVIEQYDEKYQKKENKIPFNNYKLKEFAVNKEDIFDNYQDELKNSNNNNNNNNNKNNKHNNYYKKNNYSKSKGNKNNYKKHR